MASGDPLLPAGGDGPRASFSDPVQLSPWSLRFLDSGLETQYWRDQQRQRSRLELGLLLLLLVAYASSLGHEATPTRLLFTRLVVCGIIVFILAVRQGAVVPARHQAAVRLACVVVVLALNIVTMANVQYTAGGLVFGSALVWWTPYCVLAFAVPWAQAAALVPLSLLAATLVIFDADSGLLHDLVTDSTVLDLPTTGGQSEFVVEHGMLFGVAMMVQYRLELSSRLSWAARQRLQEENIQLQVGMQPFNLASLTDWFVRNQPAAAASVDRPSSMVRPSSASFSVDRASAATQHPRIDDFDIDFRELVLRRKIGAGGSGVVYDGSFGATRVAVKELFAIINEPHELQEFAQECAVLAKLRHPNIVQFLGLSTSEFRVFLVCEFCPFSLFDMLHDSSQHALLPPFLALARQLCDACAFMHSRGVVHRDLKPENVLLSPTYQVKVCDFGLARLFDAQGADTQQDMTGGVGTPQYMAPELFTDTAGTLVQGDLAKVDVYSFGVLLWSVFFRARPFAEHSSFQLFALVPGGLRPELPADAPRALCELLAACWHADPAQRPAFDEIARRLAAFDGDDQLGSPSPSPGSGSGMMRMSVSSMSSL